MSFEISIGLTLEKIFNLLQTVVLNVGDTSYRHVSRVLALLLSDLLLISIEELSIDEPEIFYFNFLNINFVI